MLPAGYSSDEEEFTETNQVDDDDRDDCLSFSPTARRTQLAASKVRVKPLATAMPACVLDVFGQANFEWTRNSCAKRAPDSDPRPSRKSNGSSDGCKMIVSTSSFSTAVLSNDDEQNSFGGCSTFGEPSSRKHATTCNRKDDASNWSWVEKVLKEEASRSIVPTGSVDIDHMWLEKTSDIWSQKKGNMSALVKQMAECFTNVINPYTTTLYMMENVHLFSGGKKPHLLLTILKTFDQWLSGQTDKRETCVDNSVKLRAFGFIVRETSSFTSGADLMVKCFMLDKISDEQTYLDIIRQILDRKDYKKAAICIAALKFHEHFSAESVAMPLLFQGHTTHLEEFLSRNRNHQLLFLQLLDRLIDRNTNMDFIISGCDVPKIRLDLLTKKSLLKLATRLMQNYQIADELCPHVVFERSTKALRYLFYRKYLQQDMGDEQWNELVQSHVAYNTELQLELINLLIDQLEITSAAEWAVRCGLPYEVLPHQVLSMLESDEGCRIKANLNSGLAAAAAASNGGQGNVGTYHRLSLSVDHIQWVDNRETFSSCIDRIIQSAGKVVAIDAEWRPIVAQVHGQKLSLVQLAVEDTIFLLDMLALTHALNSEDWRQLIEHVFCNEKILVIGYGIQEDMRMLVRNIPVMNDYIKNLNLIDLCQLHHHIRHLHPDALACDDDKPIDPGNSDILEFKNQGRGLSDLVRQCLGRPLDKSQQMSNWDRRPLRPEQMYYAALDAYCLLEIYEVLQSKMEKLQIPLFVEEFRVAGSISLKATKLEKRQQKISAMCDVKQVERASCDINVQPQHNQKIPTEFDVVGETWTNCTGKQSFQRGVDDGLSKKAELLHRPPADQCNEVTSVLQHRNIEDMEQSSVRVEADDISRRCQICNGNRYLNVLSAEMLLAWQRRNGMDVIRAHEQLQFSANVADSSNFDHLDLNSLLLPSGCRVRPETIPVSVIETVDLFHVCANCGKIYWQGTHGQ